MLHTTAASARCEHLLLSHGGVLFNRPSKFNCLTEPFKNAILSAFLRHTVLPSCANPHSLPFLFIRHDSPHPGPRLLLPQMALEEGANSADSAKGATCADSAESTDNADSAYSAHATSRLH